MKPKPKQYYDYIECKEYIQKKYPELKFDGFLRSLEVGQNEITIFSEDFSSHLSEEHKKTYMTFIKEFGYDGDGYPGEVVVKIWW